MRIELKVQFDLDASSVQLSVDANLIRIILTDYRVRMTNNILCTPRRGCRLYVKNLPQHCSHLFVDCAKWREKNFFPFLKFAAKYILRIPANGSTDDIDKMLAQKANNPVTPNCVKIEALNVVRLLFYIYTRTLIHAH